MEAPTIELLAGSTLPCLSASASPDGPSEPLKIAPGETIPVAVDIWVTWNWLMAPTESCDAGNGADAAEQAVGEKLRQAGEAAVRELVASATGGTAALSDSRYAARLAAISHEIEG